MSAHQRLIDGLESQSSWGDLALLACLTRLRDGGPTEWREVTVLDAWSVADGFCVVYEMYGDRLGVRAHRATAGGPPFWFDRGVFGKHPTPEAFGQEIADYAVAEPLGSVGDNLVMDRDGVGWWGDPPLPRRPSI